MDRRTALRLAATGVVAAGALIGGSSATAAATEAAGTDGHGHRPGRRVPREQISVQLYTLRSVIGNNPEPVLESLRRIGYRKVELAGTYGLTAAGFRRILDRTGIRATSAHVGPDGDFARTVDDCLTLGCRYAAMPYAAYTTPQEWSALADRLSAAALLARRQGLQYGYHNHAQEFATLSDGRTGYDILLNGTDPALHMELDLYWAVTGGADPVEVVARDPRRFRQFHVKDRAPDGSFADLGAGTIDFGRIFRETRSGGRFEYIVEHDQPSDPLATARVGYDYLRDLRY
ncbi:MAG TPA: sugar phosphate isomerase/epimerase [Pseudonocardiaceae bacterium]